MRERKRGRGGGSERDEVVMTRKLEEREMT